jgi:hypothetical protein
VVIHRRCFIFPIPINLITFSTKKIRRDDMTHHINQQIIKSTRLCEPRPAIILLIEAGNPGGCVSTCYTRHLFRITSHHTHSIPTKNQKPLTAKDIFFKLQNRHISFSDYVLHLFLCQLHSHISLLKLSSMTKRFCVLPPVQISTIY